MIERSTNDSFFQVLSKVEAQNLICCWDTYIYLRMGRYNEPAYDRLKVIIKEANRLAQQANEVLARTEFENFSPEDAASLRIPQLQLDANLPIQAVFFCDRTQIPSDTEDGVILERSKHMMMFSVTMQGLSKHLTNVSPKNRNTFLEVLCLLSEINSVLTDISRILSLPEQKVLAA